MDTTAKKIGEYSLEHFHLLLVGTSIRGKEVILALEEHLVRGTRKGEACKMHEANFSQFSVRLAAIHEEDERIERMIQFYPNQVFAVASQMANQGQLHA